MYSMLSEVEFSCIQVKLSKCFLYITSSEVEIHVKHVYLLKTIFVSPLIKNKCEVISLYLKYHGVAIKVLGVAPPFPT